MVTGHDAVPGGCKLEGVGVCGEEVKCGKERGSFKCEESDILMPRFVSPIELSKNRPRPPISPIIYRTVMKLSY